MSEERPETIAERQERLVALVWPKGIPTRDRAVLDAVPLADRERLLNRLEAVWRAENGAPLAPLADLADLKRAAFYNLRIAWRTHSVAGLVPHDTRSFRRVDADEKSPLRDQARTLLRAGPLKRNVDVAKAIMASDPSLVREDAGANHALTVLQRLQRLVREERKGLTADPEFVSAAYGGELVLDLTGVQIVVEGAERSLAVAAILMETASGLVLGSALGLRDDGASLQRYALAAGMSFLSRHKADLPPVAGMAPGLGWMVPPGMEPDPAVGMLEPDVAELTIGRAGGFSFGQQVLQVVGPRIGRIPLNPRRTIMADIDIEEFLARRIAHIVTLDEARAIWAREVERHNDDRIAALTEAGIVGGGVPDGRLAAVIRALMVALQAA